MILKWSELSDDIIPDTMYIYHANKSPTHRKYMAHRVCCICNALLIDNRWGGSRFVRVIYPVIRIRTGKDDYPDKYRVYYFCGSSCLELFRLNPLGYESQWSYMV